MQSNQHRLSLHQTIENLRNENFQAMMNVFTVVGTVIYFGTLFLAVQRKSTLVSGYFSVLFLFLLIIAFSRSFKYSFRAHSLIVLIFLFGMGNLFTDGLSGTGMMWLIFTAIMTFSLLDVQKAWIVIVLSGATIILAISSFGIGWIKPLPVPDNLLLFQWMMIGLTTIVISAFMLSSLHQQIKHNRKILEQQAEKLDTISEEYYDAKTELEHKTFDSSWQSAQVSALSQIFQEFSRQTDEEILIQQTPFWLSEYLNLEWVNLFIYDENEETLVMRSFVGPDSNERFSEGFQIDKGSKGNVGTSGAKGIIRLGFEYENDEENLRHPLSKSQIALPLKVENHIIGVLEIENQQTNAFPHEMQVLLSNISSQIAISIDHARLIASLQKTILEQDTQNRITVQQSWRQHLKNKRGTLAFRYSQNKVETAAVEPEDEAQTAMRYGEIVLESENNSSPVDTPQTILAVPIKFRDQTLGVVQMRINTPTIPQDMVNMVETTTTRLALAMENTRLLEELQRSAEREHMVGSISGKVRAAVDIDNILRTTAVELGRSLGVSEVLVQIRSQDEN